MTHQMYPYYFSTDPINGTSRARNMTVPTVIDRTGETYKNNRRTTVTNKFVTSQRGPCPRHPFPYPPQGCRRAASMYRAGQAGTRVSATVQDLYPRCQNKI